MNNVHKVNVSKTEMLFYLEEMMRMDIASQLEETTYYNLMNDGAYVSVHDRLTIANTMQEWYQVEF